MDHNASIIAELRRMILVWSFAEGLMADDTARKFYSDAIAAATSWKLEEVKMADDNELDDPFSNDGSSAPGANAAEPLRPSVVRHVEDSLHQGSKPVDETDFENDNSGDE
jgi:hypothetical protein